MLSSKRLLALCLKTGILPAVTGLVLPRATSPVDGVLKNDHIGAGPELESRYALTAGVALRIMPLGASITYGITSTDGNGYRKALRNQIVAHETKVNMVGSQANGTMMDNQNEGWPGYIINEIADVAVKTVPIWQPNLVLINAGTNDCIQNVDIADASVRMTSMVENIYSQSPRATIVLSTLVDNRNSTVQARVINVNSQYRKLVAQLQMTKNHIVLADMHPYITINDIGPDGTHPTDVGYQKMAKIWFDAIAQASQSGLLCQAEKIGIPDDGDA